MKGTSVLTLALTYISWLLAFGVIALVPFDVYLVRPIQTLSKSVDEEARTSMLEAWEAIYWSVFALSWLLIPLLQEFEDSGEFTTCDRIKSGIFQFVKPAVVVLVIGAVLITIISIERNLTKYGVGRNDLLGLMIALGNLWGLLLVIVMLGYGLVAVPRSLWRAGNLEVKLKHYHFQASQLDESLDELNHHLQDIVQMIKIASASIHAESQLLPIVQMLIAKCPIHIIRESNGLRESQRATLTKELGDITRKRLISLHSDLKQTTAELSRLQE